MAGFMILSPVLKDNPSRITERAGSLKMRSISDFEQGAMRNIFDLLDIIKARPGMYVGGDSESRRSQLRNLELLICGYEGALDLHKIQEHGRNFSRTFSDYLRERFGWSMSCGPIVAIEKACQDDAEAWQRFWELIADFRAHLSRQKTISGDGSPEIS